MLVGVRLDSREPLLPRIAWVLGILAVFAIAFGTRAWFVSQCRPLEASDAAEYHELAVSILDQHAYQTVGNSGWNQGLTFQAYRPPGYPLVRAALMLAFDRAPIPALWLNVACECIALAWVIALGRTLVGRRGALLAGLFFAAYVLFTASMMTESLTMALWSALAFAAVRKPHTRDARAGIALGLALGAAILVRPVSLFWVPVLAWPLRNTFRSHKRTFFVRTLAFLVPLVCVVGAWTLRNMLVFGHLVWVSTNLGVHNAPDFGIPWSRLSELRHEGLDEPSADRTLTQEVLRAARSDWDRTLRQLLQHRFVDLFSISPVNCWELGFARTDVYRDSPDALRWLDRAIDLWRLLYVVAIVGAIGALRVKRKAESTLAGPLVLFVILQCILSRGDARLMAPATPMLAVLAAQALLPRARER